MSTLPPPPGSEPATSTGYGSVPPPPGPGAPAAGSGSGKGGVPLGLKIGFGVLALVLVAGAAVGVVAYTKLSGGGPQPADVLPADTVAYARLDLDPSAGQKIALLDLIDRVPEVKEEFGLEDVDSQADLREVAFSEWFNLDDACGVDYDDDVKPWIGERVGIALVNGFDITEDEDETALSVARNTVIVVQVTDEDAAREGLTKLATDCGILDSVSDDLGEDLDEPGIAFRDGYALVTIDQESADAIDAAADDGTLAADNDQFAADMDALGEDGIASAWYDQGSLTAKAEDALEDLGNDAEEFQEFLDAYKVLDTQAFTLRASDDSLEVAGVTSLTRDLDSPEAESLAGLPEDTLVGLSLVGGGRLADDIYQGLLPLGELFFGFGNFDYCIPEPEPIEPAVPSDPNAPLEPSDPNAPLEPDSEGDDGTLPEFEDCAAPPSFEDSLEDFQDETGLTLPDDLATLLGDELNVYVGSQGIEDVADADSFDEVLENAQAGIEFTSDGDVVDVLETLLDYSGIDLEVTATDGGAIIGTNDDAVETLEDDHGLGGTEAFGSVAEEHDRPLAGVFVDIAGVVDALKAFGMPAKEADDLAFLKAFAATAWLEDDNVIGFSAKLSFTPED